MIAIKLWVLFSLAIFAWALWPSWLSWPRRRLAPRRRIIDRFFSQQPGGQP